MKLRAMTLCTLLVLCSVPKVSAADISPMKPGKWRFTIQMDIQNMPFKMPAIAIDQCVTPEQAANPQAPKGKRDNCKYSDYKVEGNTLTWTMVCKNDMTGEGKITFGSDSYDGEAHVKSDKAAISYSYNGKLLGPCDK